MKTLLKSKKARVLEIADKHIKYYQNMQSKLVIGSMEWKYYQGKINAITDLQQDINELL